MTRQGDDATTRATFNESTRKLEFSTGDKLFVQGAYNEGEYTFAGTLDYDGDGKFSGNITTQTEWTDTFDELFTTADGVVNAYLLPEGYESQGFLSVDENNGYDAFLNTPNFSNAFATTKTAAVEQLSYENIEEQHSSNFALAPANAILNFTITDLTPSTSVDVEFSGALTISKSVTTDASGTATFAVGFPCFEDLKDISLTVEGNDITIVSESKEPEGGKIYNINRSGASVGTNLSKLTDDYEAKDGDMLTGTLGANVKITIADGATVTLSGVSINADGNWTDEWAGITCEGDATIILSGTNTVKGFYDEYPGIYVPENKTLTIQGTGSLDASSNGYGAGIGGGYYIACGNITIEGGNITATGGDEAAGIGGGRDESCGNISITGGTVEATGGDDAPGIGGGHYGSCGTITITTGVTSVTATKGNDAPKSIGVDDGCECGKVTIGGTVYPDGISDSPYTYSSAVIIVRWNNLYVDGIPTGSGVTMTGYGGITIEDNGYIFLDEEGHITFSNSLGKKFTKIVFNTDSWLDEYSDKLGEGWRYVDDSQAIWEGKAESVNLFNEAEGNIYARSIEFTLE